ncbi:TPA: AraC family transcriptional regulator [Klebsiella pneumoniae]|uniref:helix-turn-helix transcriptional regulator n=1 Tax=Enterobacteriaceae TaxID=543 RepID=UPI00073BC6A1|nr:MULTISPECIES: AraC family transcriptional regulator [Enterobacteriaceae]ARM25718.1 AraC family transcriptional regulator [Klebsiella pneumoniae]ASB81728.1 AraC family transcriptional regulator [Escherichia coli]KSW91181.1 AraC family transcriptional regulator [Klebsiella pneumoniae]HBQ2685749.1 AraC family transcriptional regulator [Klebsiella pneumoniae]
MNTYNTADVLYAERSEYWRHAISHTFVPLESTFSGNDRYGVIRSGNWGDLRLSEVSCSAQDVIRCRRGADNHPDNAMLLSFISQGKTSVIQAGSHACLGQGEFGLYDTRFPYELHLHSETRQHVVQIPIDHLRQELGKTEHLVAYSFGKKHSLTPFLHVLLNNLMAQPEDIASRHISVLYRQLLELLTVIVSDECRAKRSSRSSAGLLLQIKIMIDQQLSDTTLSVSSIAESFRISPRYLSMLLKSDGTTFGRYVLTQRLNKASLALQSPLYSDIPISQIAWKLGFNDMAYFSRAFREKFSCSPTEYRHQADEA